MTELISKYLHNADITLHLLEFCFVCLSFSILKGRWKKIAVWTWTFVHIHNKVILGKKKKIFLLSVALLNPWFTHLNFQLLWSTSYRHKWSPGCHLQFSPYYLLSSTFLRSDISVSYTHTAKLGFLQLKSCFVSMRGDSSSFKITFLMRQNAAIFVKPYKTVISSSQFKILMCLKNTNLPRMLFLIQNHVEDKNFNANFISQRISKEINLRF